jgi:hypothetical protein
VFVSDIDITQPNKLKDEYIVHFVSNQSMHVYQVYDENTDNSTRYIYGDHPNKFVEFYNKANLTGSYQPTGFIMTPDKRPLFFVLKGVAVGTEKNSMKWLISTSEVLGSARQEEQEFDVPLERMYGAVINLDSIVLDNTDISLGNWFSCGSQCQYVGSVVQCRCNTNLGDTCSNGHC